MNKKNISIGLTIAMLLVISLLWVSKKFRPENGAFKKPPFSGKITEVQPESIDSIQSYVIHQKIKAGEKPDPKNPNEVQDLAFDLYVKSNKGASFFHELGLKVFGDSSAGKAAADWIALTLNPEESPAYGRKFLSSLYTMNQEPATILKGLDDHHDLIVSQSFLHSMSINLINQLNISRAAKIRYLAKELTVPFEIEKDGEYSPQAANVLLALGFLKQYDVQASEIREAIENAKRANRPGSQEYYAFQMNVNNHIPGSDKLF